MPNSLVALSATTRVQDGTERVQVNQAYVAALRLAGLTPVIVPPMDDAALPGVLDAVAGVVLSGGEDVDPARYRAARGPHTEDPHPGRDATELALARLARDRQLPTLAICRGLQVANVALGGTLVQDIPSECPGALPHRADKAVRAHAVAVEAGSLLARTVGTTEFRVNTSHHQALARVGEGLRVTARAPDGVVEAAEWAADDAWWMLGVQWHPEELVGDAEGYDRAIFDAFARRVRGEPG